MPNDLGGNPYKIDTAGVITTVNGFVRQMVWQRPVKAEDKLVISDFNGRILWDQNAYAGGAGIPIKRDINCYCNGIKVDIIDSGTLFIHFR